MSRKDCVQVSCSSANGKAVLRSTGSGAQKGLIDEQEKRKNKRRMNDTAEIQGSLAGHRYHEYSDLRCRLARLVVTFFFLVFLDRIHWMSRSSTVSTSVPGTLFIIAGDMVALAVILRNYLQAGKLGRDQ
ncbi:hypothetical protein B0H10DRAFT_2270926 [Mycena sp. CBHHK59/15]|nr:hypothetical protein B0H10DRAFT_2270926 [Mycena sp. CBHHK59/15]